MAVLEWLRTIGASLIENLESWIVPVISLAALTWAIRTWLYGGSVVRVQLELGKLDADGRLLKASSRDWRNRPSPEDVLGVDLDPMHVDVAVITARNHGRTPTTITDVGLRFGRVGGHPVHYGGQLLEPGETSPRVRIEAHDARTLIFPIAGMVDGARKLAKEGGDASCSLKARAQVTTGVGKERRSSRRSAWEVGTGDSVLGGGAPSVDAQLFTQNLRRGVSVVEAGHETRLVMMMLRDNKDPLEIMEDLTEGVESDDAGRPVRLMLLALRGRHLLDEQKSASGAEEAAGSV